MSPISEKPRKTAKRRKKTKRAVRKKKAVATKPRAKKAQKKNPKKNPRTGVGNNADLLPGNPGNSGGKPGRSGRRPSAIREHCRGSFAERVAILEAIADGKPLPTTKIIGHKMVKIQLSAAIKERTQAIDMLGKYGGVAELALTIDEQPEEADTPERVVRLWEMLQQLKDVAALEELMVDHAKKQHRRGES